MDGMVRLQIIRYKSDSDSSTSVGEWETLSSKMVPEASLPRRGDWIDLPVDADHTVHSMVVRITTFYALGMGDTLNVSRVEMQVE